MLASLTLYFTGSGHMLQIIRSIKKDVARAGLIKKNHLQIKGTSSEHHLHKLYTIKKMIGLPFGETHPRESLRQYAAKHHINGWPSEIFEGVFQSVFLLSTLVFLWYFWLFRHEGGGDEIWTRQSGKGQRRGRLDSEATERAGQDGRSYHPHCLVFRNHLPDHYLVQYLSLVRAGDYYRRSL